MELCSHINSILLQIVDKRNELIEKVCSDALGRKPTKADAKYFNLVVDLEHNTFISYRGHNLGQIKEVCEGTNWTMSFIPAI